MALRWLEEEVPKGVFISERTPPAVGYPTEPGTIWDRTWGLDPFGYDGHSRWPLQRLRGLGIPWFQSAHVWKPPSCKRLVRVLSAMLEVRFQHQLVVSLAFFVERPFGGIMFPYTVLPPGRILPGLRVGCPGRPRFKGSQDHAFGRKVGELRNVEETLLPLLRIPDLKFRLRQGSGRSGLGVRSAGFRGW